MKKNGRGALDKARGIVTDRDIEIVRWLGRHRLATAEQVMRRFDLGRSKAYQRLSIAVDAGLIRYEQGVRNSRVYLATTPGLQLAALDLGKATVSEASFAHDLALVDAAIPLEKTPGLKVLSERELRQPAEDGTKSPYFLREWGGNMDVKGFWPDLVVWDLARNTATAIEVELTLKTQKRLHAKLAAYDFSRFPAVRYICANQTIARAVFKQYKKACDNTRVTFDLIDNPSPIPPVEQAIADLRSKLDTLHQNELDLTRQIESANDATKEALKSRDTLLNQLDRFLAADRSTRKQMLVQWERLVARGR